MTTWKDKTEKAAGIDQLPDGRWTYTPVGLFGRITNARSCIVDESMKDKIVSTYRWLCGSGAMIGAFLARHLSNHEWVYALIDLAIILILWSVFSYKFSNFSSGLEEYLSENINGGK